MPSQQPSLTVPLTLESDPSTLSDEELMQAYRSGQISRDSTVTELFVRYRARVARWCLRLTRDRELARDLAQDVFMRAYKSLDTYRGESRVSTWIYVIARNQSITVRERRGSEPDRVDLNAAASWPDPNSTAAYNRIDDLALYGPKCAALLRALTRTEAAVLMMHYGEDLPLALVTRRLGLKNKSGAKAYIVSARRKLEPIAHQRFSTWVEAQV